MASTYTDLKVELIGTGEQSGSWGTTTNTNLGTALEEAIVGTVDVAFSSGTVTLTLSNSNATQSARHLRLNLTGTSGGAQNLVVPAIQKNYLVNNGTADTITVKTPSGSGIGVPSGKTMWVYNNGSNVVGAVTAVTSLQVDEMTLDSDTLTATDDFIIDAVGDITLDADGNQIKFKDGSTIVGQVSMDSSNLILESVVNDKNLLLRGIDNGGTIVALEFDMSEAGAASFNGAVTANAGVNSSGTVTSSGTLAVTGNLTVDGASGTAGQVLTSAGSGATPTWSTALPSGAIILWSGATDAIPTGFVICNGSNSTPDLRNRFVVGAGDTYSVNATGGSADATLVSHTHSATSSVSDSGHFHNVLPTLSGAFSNNGGFIQTATTGTPGQTAVGNTDTKTTGISVSTSISTAGSSATNANLPPYYALAYIMKT